VFLGFIINVDMKVKSKEIKKMPGQRGGLLSRWLP